mmetsp:Transcript_27075/g.23968  ORF Transcript_27075/g.23968 Transcript_27075/m.23968 type:complete len:106 (+) Transcript_27075:87-404(+)
METSELVKLVMVGDTNVGKTSLISRFVHKEFNDHKPNTVGVDFATATMNINETPVAVQLWDTAGQERFRSMVGSYFKIAHGVVIVFDLTKEDTMDSVDYWLKTIE